MSLLAERHIPISINAAPVIPGLTDEELPTILRESALCGAITASYILVRLPLSVEPLFLDWLRRELPQRAPKILSRLREVRNGKLSDGNFETRQWGEGEMARSIRGLFEVSCRKYGLNRKEIRLDTGGFQRGCSRQLAMF